MNPPSAAKTWALRAAATAAVGFLVWTYVDASARGASPKGHPWHGLALATMAGFFLVQVELHRGTRTVRTLAVVLPLCAIASMAMALIVTKNGNPGP
ncbi:MAG: hypothetical protein ACO4CZ_10695 [Planctomycetota bacterium]|jgi:hypothetical protein